MGPLPTILIHGYSSEGATNDADPYARASVEQLYGRMVADLSTLDAQPIPVNVSRYVSLDDGLSVEDLSFGLDRALKADYPGLLESGFNAIIHSTGALVARNWIRRYNDPNGKCPLKRLIHLAGANLGSGWAHVGESQFVRFARAALHEQRGLAVLHSLELASDWAIDLHTHFLQPGNDMLRDYGVMEFCLVGNEVPPEYLAAPVRYGKEDGADGVVRVSASNLNFNYLRISPTVSARDIDWDLAMDYVANMSRHTPMEDPGDSTKGGYYALATGSKPGENGRTSAPFAIPYATCHSEADGRRSIMSGSVNRQYVLPLVKLALDCTPETYADVSKQFDAATASTYEKVRSPEHDAGIFEKLFGAAESLFSGDPEAALTDLIENPKKEYDPHSQLVFRIVDHLGVPVPDYSIFFNSFGGGQPSKLINCLFEDQHKNLFTANTMNFYIRSWTWKGEAWENQIPAVNGVSLEIDAVDPGTRRVLYLPVRLDLPNDELLKWIEPHRTTIVDVQLMRLPSTISFLIR
jgi:hypothetical protein